MDWRTHFPHWAALVGAAFVSAMPLPAALADDLQFNRDIRPILSENCFFCHGQDAKRRKADLRLDNLEGATAIHDGGSAVVPGDPGKSRIIARIESKDPDEQMPPAESHRKVSAAQLAKLKRWISAGAAYEKHWAFIKPVKTTPPAVQQKSWPRQPMDAFVLARLEKEQLSPAAPAQPDVWLRRVSFDLTGLAPTLTELERFSADVAASGELAYASAADRLLASPRFGERMAQEWLDAARYADTHGFNNDSSRSMWRWRDWVIESFNANQPYDRFLIEQLAGDLLPNATLDQRIATGFGRNHVINSEGGIIDEEYRVEYVVDRVRTLGMTALGLTAECARCHDHKFDPITQRDYYRLFAFFNQVPEIGEDGRIANAAPIMPAPTREQQAQFADLDRKITAESAAMSALVSADEAKHPDATLAAHLKASARAVSPPPADGKLVAEKASSAHSIFGPVLQLSGVAGLSITKPGIDFTKPWSFAGWTKWRGGAAPLFSNMDWQKPASAKDYGAGNAVRLTAEGKIEADLALRWPAYSIQVRTRQAILPDQWHHLAVTYDAKSKGAGVRIYIDGLECDTDVVNDDLQNAVAGQAALHIGDEAAPAALAERLLKFKGELAEMRFFARVLEPAAIAAWVEPNLALAYSDSSPAELQPKWVRQWLLRKENESFTRHWDAREAMKSERRVLDRAVPTTMVMAELSTPRVTHLLRRGQYDALGEEVSAGVPESLLGAWPDGAPKNRLGLAKWLTGPNHPLTARVAVNRFWQQLFGVGLVKTSEDFGSQGEYPFHPELLDGLAREFIDGGWNVKKLFRTLVLSSTYRQDSTITPALRERDPENRLLARGPRVRLQAEAIRDHVLASAGLLKERVGGPSVYPHQPVDLYKGIVVDAKYPGTTWTDSTGDDRYRRSLYTFWKRTVPHPVMTVLDAPDREFCSVRRSRTNTPLQALMLMNEPAMLEAARQLGQEMLHSPGDDSAKLAMGFRRATSRSPAKPELAVLAKTLVRFREEFAADVPAAKAFGQSDVVDAAAFSAMGSLLLNLDETMTKS